MIRKSQNIVNFFSLSYRNFPPDFLHVTFYVICFDHMAVIARRIKKLKCYFVTKSGTYRERKQISVLMFRNFLEIFSVHYSFSLLKKVEVNKKKMNLVSRSSYFISGEAFCKFVDENNFYKFANNSQDALAHLFTFN